MAKKSPRPVKKVKAQRRTSFELRGLVPPVLVEMTLAGGVTSNATSRPATGLFLVLLERLLELLAEVLGASFLNSEAGRLEQAEAEFARGGNGIVGTWNGKILEYNDLSEPIPMDVDLPRKTGLSTDRRELAKWELAIKTGNKRLEAMSRVARGYLGWLLTNQQYLQEQDGLLSERRSEAIRYGLIGAGQVFVVDPLPLSPELETDPARLSNEGFHLAVRQFLVRWRLLSLAAPDLPVPMKPMLSGLFPISILQQLMDAGGLFNLPDTFPILSRDELRGILTDALRPNEEVEHLAEWHGIVRAANPAKNKIDRFARIRQLYHYWRLLHERHAGALAKKKEKLWEVFARFLRVGQAAIKADLGLIRRRLGASWEKRETPLSRNS